MKVGYLRCAACGAETNCVELTAGLCPACKDERVWGLRLLAAPSVAQMRRAIAGASEGDAYGA